MKKAPNSVRRLLEDRGYRAVRFGETERWTPLNEVNGRLGTTEDTQVTKTGTRKQRAILTESETGKHLGTARKEAPDPAGRADGDSSEEGRTGGHKLKELKSQIQLPNVHTAAYLLAKTHMEGRDDADHEALVTTVNLTVLRAWAEGLRLTDLDAVSFRTIDKGGDLALEIEGENSSVSVPLESRSCSLKKPWDGRYSVAAISGRVGS